MVSCRRRKEAKGLKSEVKSSLGDALLKWRRSEHSLSEPVLVFKREPSGDLGAVGCSLCA